MEIDKNAPLCTLTVGQFTDLIESANTAKENVVVEVPKPDKYAYGLNGLAELLGCGRTTAWTLKNSGKLDKAITQTGRLIIIDKEKALELLGRKK